MRLKAEVKSGVAAAVLTRDYDLTPFEEFSVEPK